MAKGGGKPGEEAPIDWRAVFFDRTMIVMTAAMALTGVACWFIRGREAFFESFVSDFWTLIDILPKMALAFVTAALVQRLVPREFITRWLGEQTGYKGVAIATGVIEGAVARTSGITNISSRSGQGNSFVQIEFSTSTDIGERKR